MLPSANVDLFWDVDFDSLADPSMEDLECGFGFRQYSVAVVLESSWEEAIDSLAADRETVVRIAAQAQSEAEFDERASECEGDVILDPMEGFVAGPDLGVRATVAALCAGGFLTAASCRGHAGQHAWSRYPVIHLSCDSARARVLEPMAKRTGCGLAGGGGRLELWSRSVTEMLDLADELIAHREDLAALPWPDALSEVADDRGADHPPQDERLF